MADAEKHIEGDFLEDEGLRARINLRCLMDWSSCPLIVSDPEIVHGQPVLIGTRVPAETVVENVEAYLEEGLSLDQAIDATLECFPSVPEGAEGIRAILAYRGSHQAEPAL